MTRQRDLIRFLVPRAALALTIGGAVGFGLWAAAPARTASQFARAISTSGWLALVLCLAAAAYGLRKLTTPGPGALDRWLRLHGPLGGLAGLAVLVHVSLGVPLGFGSLPRGTGAWALATTLALILTGLGLQALYAWLPPRLARWHARRLDDAAAWEARAEELVAGSPKLRRAMSTKLGLLTDAPAWRDLEPPPGLDQAELARFHAAADALARRGEAREEAVAPPAYTPLRAGSAAMHGWLTAGLVVLVAGHVLETRGDFRQAGSGYPASTECAGCHPAVVAEWRASSHAAAAESPLTRAMNAAGNTQGLKATCMGCHSPVGGALGLFDDSAVTGELASGLPLEPASAGEGVTCVACHRAEHYGERPVAFGASGPPAPVRHRGSVLGAFAPAAEPRPVRQSYHSSRRDAGIASSELCRTCHNVILVRAGESLHLQNTYSEWAASSYGAAGVTCQDCHMPATVRAGTIRPVGAAFDGPLPERGRFDHRFAGPDWSWWREAAGPTPPEVDDLMRQSVALTIAAPPRAAPDSAITVTVAFTNTGGGHDLPTGLVFEREAWLEVVAQDAAGRTLFASGLLDAHGRLMDELNPDVRRDPSRYDPWLVNLRGRMVRWPADLSAAALGRPEAARFPVNWNGTPVLWPGSGRSDVARLPPGMTQPAGPIPEEVFLQTEAAGVLSAGLGAGEARVARYSFEIPSSVSRAFGVRARLRLRPFPPHVVDVILGRPDLATRLPIADLGSARAEIEVP